MFFIGARHRLRAGGPRRHLEARARPGPPGRHQDHADRRGRPDRRSPRGGPQDHRPAGQRLRRRRGRGHRPGQPFIVVEIPGAEPRATSSRPCKRQAQLRFRLVACSDRVGARAARRATPRDPDRGRAGRRRGRPDRDPAARGHARARRRRRRRRRVAVRQRQPGPGRATPTRPPSPTADRRRRRTEPRPSADRRPRASEAPPSRADPGTRGRRGRRRPADLDRQPQPGGGRRLQRVHLPDRRHAGQRRGRPGEAAGHLRVPTTRPAVEVPAVRRDDRGHRARRRGGRDPAEPGQLRRDPRLRRRGHRGLRRHLPGAGRHREAVRDRPRRPGPLRADDGRADPRRPGPDQRATSPRRAPRAWRPASSTARCRSRSRSEHHGRDRSARRWPATSCRPACSPAPSACCS